MPEQKDVSHPATERVVLPTREQLLAEGKEELILHVESLARELQRREELEEEILHLNFQEGTASLQAQVEEASRRFRVAQQEIEAFRAEILAAEEDPGRMAPRPFVFVNLEATPSGTSDPSQLRSLLTVFRRLRGDRDRLLQEADRARGEAGLLRKDLEDEQARSAKRAEEASSLQAQITALREKLADLERRIK
jgi:chromosome segregation ATPase